MAQNNISNNNFDLSNYVTDYSKTGTSSTNGNLPSLSDVSLFNNSNSGFGSLVVGSSDFINAPLSNFTDTTLNYSSMNNLPKNDLEAALTAISAVSNSSTSVNYYASSDMFQQLLQQNPISNFYSSNYGTVNCSSTGSNSGSANSDVVADAKQYLGCNEADGSYLQFTGGRQEAWCADFVTKVVKESYAKAGKSLPSDFGSPSVENIKSWGENNGCYVDGNQKSQVKAGDLVIFRNGGHVGIVESIDSDGTVHTIEGNTSDKVAEREYSGSNSSITGFVLLSKVTSGGNKTMVA